MAYTLATMEECVAKAGANINSTLSGSSILSKFYDESEAWFCASVRLAVSTISGVALAKALAGDAISSHVGNKCINYDPSGYTSTGEATLLTNNNIYTYDKIVNMFEDKNTKAFLGVS